MLFLVYKDTQDYVCTHGELSFKIFCLFFIELFMFLLLSYKTFVYSRCNSFVVYMFYKQFLSAVI